MSIFSEIFESGFDIYKFLNQRSKTKDVHKNLILRELKNNIRRLEHRNKSGVNKFVLIQKLENQSIVEAIKTGFNFNKLAPRQKVDKEIANKILFAKKYIGWNTEKIILSLDEKIVALKEIDELFNKKGSQVNITQRLNNVFHLCVLLIVLIKRV
ncbi:MAG: hypothetical protein JXA77_07170 [Bacteroidales bacterium]|nr:hypothetical protein [Bacteroidales bacterium]MBN2819656.1 hypothetical protein [Bacteroidales bacterium]